MDFSAPTRRPAPARGTRPRNRRELIIAAATDLFYRRGYPHVGMADIAEAVAIGRSALYRHFGSRQELLSAVLLEAITAVRGDLTFTGPEDYPGALNKLAVTALEHRATGVLWQREVRHLPPVEQERVRDELRAIAKSLAVVVQDQRPELDSAAADLLAWSLLAVMLSVSFHHVQLPGPDYERLLIEMTGGVLRVELPFQLLEGQPQTPPTQVLSVQSRREVLLGAAIEMFAERGYQDVGIEDIGAAAGISGPAIYQYFPTKNDLLIAAINRSAEWLQMDMQRTLAAAIDAGDGLRGLLRSYAGFTLNHHHLVDLLITETEHLPEQDQQRSRQLQHDYIAEWVHLLMIVHPVFSREIARVRIQAALTVANDIARTPHLRSLPGIADAIHEIGCAILQIPTA